MQKVTEMNSTSIKAGPAHNFGYDQHVIRDVIDEVIKP